MVDIDSQLLNLRTANAAVGLSPATDLSGGCICCAKQDELAGVLERIRNPVKGMARPDYLVCSSYASALLYSNRTRIKGGYEMGEEPGKGRLL